MALTARQWKALDLMVYELQAENEMQPMGLMGIDLMRRVATERIEAAQKLLRQIDRIEAFWDEKDKEAREP